MSLRTWGNGLAAAGIIVAVGLGVLANGGWAPDDTRFWAVLGPTLLAALIVVVLLRPPRETPRSTATGPAEAAMEAIWRKVSVRDVAFLRTAVRFQHWPKQVSDEANRLAPPGERWAPESKERAEERARDLIALGVLQWRGSEVETTELGRNLIAYGERQR